MIFDSLRETGIGKAIAGAVEQWKFDRSADDLSGRVLSREDNINTLIASMSEKFRSFTKECAE